MAKEPALGHTAWPFVSRTKASYDPGQRQWPQYPGNIYHVLDICTVPDPRAPWEGKQHCFSVYVRTRVRTMKTLAQGPIVWQLIIMPQGGMLLACLKDILITKCVQNVL